MRTRAALVLLLLAAPPLAARVPDQERVALAALYRSTGGGAWRDHSGWLGRSGTECRWHGVVCDSQESAVVELRLSSNGLAGEIPPELAGLTRLRVLDLRSNALDGAIPAELGRADSLEILDLAYNGLTGDIPSGLGRLGLLRVLSLEHNALTGVSAGLGRLASLVSLDLSFNPIADLPDDLARLERLRSLRLVDGRLAEIPVLALRALEVLDLSGNPMAGAGIPDGIGDLDRLVRLACAGCGLAGPLPSGIGLLTRLQELDFRNNWLEALPDELADLATLRVLRLSWNRLGGGMPELAGLSNLEALDLSGNPFTPGPVPESYRGLRRLRELDLRASGRTGEFPPWLPDLERLAWLDLAENPFEAGPVPAFFQDMTLLRRLLLDRTNRTGALPEWIGTTDLTLLSLRDNAFDPGPLPVFLATTRIGHLDLGGTGRTGALPPLVAANASLRVLRLDHNHLTGPVPPEWGSFRSLEILDLAGNGLAGPVPSELIGLSRLLDGQGLDLRWNALTAPEPELAAWLDAKAGDWRSSQTLAPRKLSAVLTGPVRVRLSWSVVRYRAEGGYEVLHATSPDGPFTWIAATNGKLATEVDIEGLAPRTHHWFRVRTATDPHADNPNRVVSFPGPAVDVVTLPATDAR
jgi:Leucine-rich repeat (LRR) protein